MTYRWGQSKHLLPVIGGINRFDLLLLWFSLSHNRPEIVQNVGKKRPEIVQSSAINYTVYE